MSEEKSMELTRRSLIVRGGMASGAVALRAVSPITTLPKAHKAKIVFTGGHPGDPEYGCGGTIASFVEQGHEVVLLYLNDGAWPPTPAATRMAEAKRACELLGVRPAYAGQTNGAAIVDNLHYEDFARRLNAEAPDAVFTHWMIDNHRDHRSIAMLSYDAWQKSGSKFALYYYEVSDGEDSMQFSPNRYVDITRMESRKKAACYAHASQTPDRYYALQDQVARFRGLASGYTRAEAFVWQERSPFDILSPSAQV
jgi:LmbE family N-acetylglucosaminyl deacetylase